MILEFCLPKIKMTKWSIYKQTTTIGRQAVLSREAEIAPLCLGRHSLQKTLDVGHTQTADSFGFIVHPEASPSSTCHARTACCDLEQGLWRVFDFMTVNPILL